MGVWQVDADVLANSRFVISPATETLACLSKLEYRSTGPGEDGWLGSHLPGYEAMMAADPLRRVLIRTALRPRNIADFLTTIPLPTDRGIADQLARIRMTPHEVAFKDLHEGGLVPDELRTADLGGIAAAMLGWVWKHVVEPDWPRRRRVFEADIVARTQRLAAGGWATALEGMRPSLRWVGDGRLRINKYDNPPRLLRDAELMFIPSTARTGWVDWHLPLRYAVIYRCTGLLGTAPAPPPPHALSRLLGPGRAQLLSLLDSPLSTSQLVAMTGMALGSVGGHLRVLLDAQLVCRRRAGRSVLYSHTELGRSLVTAMGPPQPGGPIGQPTVRSTASTA